MIVSPQANGSPVKIATPKMDDNPVVSDLDPDLAALFATLGDLHKNTQALVAKHKAMMPKKVVAPPAAAAPPAGTAPAPAKPNPFAPKDASAAPAKPNPFAPKAKDDADAKPDPFKKAFSHFKDKKQRDEDVNSDPNIYNNLDDEDANEEDEELDPNDDDDDPEHEGDDPLDDPGEDDGDPLDDPRSYGDDPEDDEPNDKDDDEDDDDEEFGILTPVKKQEVLTYADEHGQTLPIDSKAQVRKAWDNVSSPDGASNFTAITLVAVKSRIKAAAEKMGVEIE